MAEKYYYYQDKLAIKKHLPQSNIFSLYADYSDNKTMVMFGQLGGYSSRDPS